MDGRVESSQRHTKRNPCRVCGGHADMPQGHGTRCAGFRSADGEWEHCQREQYAGTLPLDERTIPPTYLHRLRGQCKCGVTHGPELVRPAARRLPASVTRYELRDAEGRLAGVHVRKDYLDAAGHPYREKSVWWERHNGRSLNEMPLYGLRFHLDASADALRIICEGEKATDALNEALKHAGRANAVLALGTATGASALPCEESLRPLVGFPVALWPDNDDIGRQHMEGIAARLEAMGAPAPKWIVWPDAPAKGDAADYVARGGAIEGLLQLVTERPIERPASPAAQPGRDDRSQPPETGTGSAAIWQPTVQRMRDLMRKELPPVKWAVRDLIAEGLTLLAAKAKKGKSTLMLHISASVAGGTPALGQFDTERGDVLYLALEDNERRMQRRMRQMYTGDVPAGLSVVYEWLPLDHGGEDALDRWLDAHPATRMVVIDTLEHIRPKRRIANGLYGDDYAAVRGLQRLASKYQVAIVIITHLRKSPADDPFDEINASMGLLASVDNAMVMRPANGIMELHRSGREYDDVSTLALKGDAATLLWSVEGQAEHVTRSAERKAIINVLPGEDAAEGNRMRPAEIADAVGKPVGAIRKLLWHMLREEHPAIAKDKKGWYYALGNAGNAGNASDASRSRHSAEHGTSRAHHGITEGVSPLPADGTGGNGGNVVLSPHGASGAVPLVTGVTGVTASRREMAFEEEEVGQWTF